MCGYIHVMELSQIKRTKPACLNARSAMHATTGSEIVIPNVLAEQKRCKRNHFPVQLKSQIG